MQRGEPYAKFDSSYNYKYDRENHEVYRWDNRPIIQTFTPFIRSLVTDIFTFPYDLQHDKVCGQIEWNMMKCLEAYGNNRGYKVCRDFVDDYWECTTHDKQRERCKRMRKERSRQYVAGERPIKYSVPPRMGSYKWTTD